MGALDRGLVRRDELHTVTHRHASLRPSSKRSTLRTVRYTAGVSSRAKLILRILSGRSDRGIPFDELCGLLRHFGFDERVRGSHHIFRRGDVEERINLQQDGGQAKPYQVKQVRAVIIRYRLGGDES